MSIAWCRHTMWFSLQHIGWKVENYAFPEWNTINHWSFEKINPGAKLRYTICKIFTDSLSIHGVAHNSPTLQLSVSATPGLQDHHHQHQHQHQKLMNRSPAKRFSSKSFLCKKNLVILMGRPLLQRTGQGLVWSPIFVDQIKEKNRWRKKVMWAQK